MLPPPLPLHALFSLNTPLMTRSRSGTDRQWLHYPVPNNELSYFPIVLSMCIRVPSENVVEKIFNIHIKCEYEIPDLVLNIAAITWGLSLTRDLVPCTRKNRATHAFNFSKKNYRGLASSGNVLPGGNNRGSCAFRFRPLLVGGGNVTARLHFWQSEHTTSPSNPDFLHCAFENKLLGLYLRHAKHNITLQGCSTLGGKAAMLSRSLDAKAS